MLGIVNWLVKRIAEKLPSRYVTYNGCCQHKNLTFYSSIEENCQQIVSYRLRPKKAPLKKFDTERKMSPENCPRQTPTPKELPPRNKATPQEIYVVF